MLLVSGCTDQEKEQKLLACRTLQTIYEEQTRVGKMARAEREEKRKVETERGTTSVPEEATITTLPATQYSR